MSRGLILCAIVLVFAASGAAHAQPVDVCTTTYEGAQQLMRAGSLLRSRSDLSTCESACPRALAKDCHAWREEVERQIPSLQVSAKGADGSDPGRVRVIVDGVVLAESLTLEPIEVDPGKHTLTFQASTQQRVDVSVEVPRGRKGYAVEVRFPANAPPIAAPSAAPPPPPPPPLRPRSPGPFVLFGVGFTAASVGAALGIHGQIVRSNLRRDCAPHCQQGDIDAIAREWTVGAATAATGGAAALAGALWWLIDDHARQPGAALTILPGPGSITVSGRF